MRRNADRDAAIVAEHEQGATYASLGRKYGITGSRVRHIVWRAEWDAWMAAEQRQWEEDTASLAAEIRGSMPGPWTAIVDNPWSYARARAARARALLRAATAAITGQPANDRSWRVSGSADQMRELGFNKHDDGVDPKYAAWD